MAEELGYLLAARGCSLMSGGHGGIAEALADGAARGGGGVTGVSLSEAHYLQRTAPVVPRIVETVQAATVAERLACFARADGFVFFSGGIGSLAEFAFIWHSLQLEMSFDRPVVLVSRSWKPVLAEFRRVQMVQHRYYRYLHLCDGVRDAVAVLTGDYTLKYGDGRARYDKECVLFGLDGTIAVSPEEAFLQACEDAGLFFPKPAVIAAFGKAGGHRETGGDALSFHRRVLELLGIDGAAADGIAERMAGDARNLPDLYPDAVETVHRFRKRGVTVGVISSRPPAQLERLLTNPPLAGLFDFVVGDNGSRGEEGLFDRALQRAGIRREGVLYVGDRLDADSRAAGVDAVILDRHLDHILDDGAVTIRSLRELEYLVGTPARPGGG
jgi:predicted Rossmann-fold nucleotide-binding protein/FMN phosphatase YigB (HAD superfamily)